MHNYTHKGGFPMGPLIYWYYWVVFSTGWICFHSTVSTDQGLRQSPVDIATKAMSYDSELRNNPLVFSYKYEQDIEIHNNGYTIVVPIKQPSSKYSCYTIVVPIKQPSSKYLQVSRIPLHELLVICIHVHFCMYVKFFICVCLGLRVVLWWLQCCTSFCV